MKLVNILNVLICILCGYIHVHVHVYCDVVCSTHIGTCSYVIVSYLIMNDNIDSCYNNMRRSHEAYIYKLITCLIMNIELLTHMTVLAYLREKVNGLPLGLLSILRVLKDQEISRGLTFILSSNHYTNS